MTYHQITFAELYTLGLLRQRGASPAAIAHLLGRHRSTISREVRRNRAHSDATYRLQLADWYARSRRSRSRRNRRLAAALGGARDQPRDDLPLHLGGQTPRRTLHQHLRGRAQAVPQALWALRQPRAAGREAPHYGAPGGGRAADRGGPLGAGHAARSGASRSLRAEPGRT